MNTPEQKVARCPRCGGKDIRRSYSRGLLDALMRMARRSAYRCRGCQRRFYRLDDAAPPPDQAGL